MLLITITITIYINILHSTQYATHPYKINEVYSRFPESNFPGLSFSRRCFQERRFPDGHFPGRDISRTRRFPERRFLDGNFPRKTFPGWSLSRKDVSRKDDSRTISLMAVDDKVHLSRPIHAVKNYRLMFKTNKRHTFNICNIYDFRSYEL